jgi:hypothetical protein
MSSPNSASFVRGYQYSTHSELPDFDENLRFFFIKPYIPSILPTQAETKKSRKNSKNPYPTEKICADLQKTRKNLQKTRKIPSNLQKIRKNPRKSYSPTLPNPKKKPF